MNDIVNSTIITTQIKSDQNYRNKLAYLARSDAHHDLGEEFKRALYESNSNIKTAFDSGLPAPATNAYHEGEAFASVIITANDVQIQTAQKPEELLKDQLSNVANVTNTPETTNSIFTVGVEGQPIFTYNVVQFIIPTTNNTSELKELSCKENFGKKFVQNTQLGGQGLEAAIIVDFSQHHFIEKLVEGEEYKDFTIHYLMTPEVVNDPAGKPNVNNKSLFSSGTGGINLMSYVQTDPEPIYYSKFNEHEPNPANNFFSNYDFTLSPIQQIYTKQKAEKLITTLNIKYEMDNKTLTDTIEDSKGENSITTVLGFIRSLIKKILSERSVNNVANFNFNSKCQQKRGGDWFQALSCLDARNRDYTRILPSRGQPSRLNNMCPVYFATHDRIAVAYALLNGVNVIYTDYYGRIFVFKNNADPTVKGNGKPMEEILFTGMKTKWYDGSRRDNELDPVLITARKYQAIRHVIFKNELSEYIKTCEDALQKIKGLKNEMFVSILPEILKNVFKSAVRLMFVKINLVDISNEIDFIEKNYTILNGEYVADNNPVIYKLSKSLNVIKSIEDKFGRMSGKDITAQGKIEEWLSNNVPKLDVFRAANRLYEGTGADDEKTVTFDVRMLDFVSNDVTYKTDKYVFLPFIQTLGNINVANELSGGVQNILVILNELTVKTVEYFNFITGITGITGNSLNLSSNSSSSVYSIMKTMRGGRLNPQQIFYNRTANLVYEALVLLNNAEQPEITINVEEIKDYIIISETTDHILLSEDKNEIDVLREGKVSNSTEDGSGEDTTNKAIPTQKQSVICDVSVKQTTWTLLTGNLFHNFSLKPLYNIFNVFKTKVPESKYELTPDEIIENMEKDMFRANKKRDREENVDLINKVSKIGGANDANKEHIILMAEVLNSIFLEYTDASGDVIGDDTDLLSDFGLGYHPLMPIYMILTSFYSTLSPKYNNHPFYYTYFTYFNILQKMVDVIERKYLNEPYNKRGIIAGYCIGFMLRSLLFTSHTSVAQNNKLLEVIDISQNDFYTFSLKNDGFASLISGAIHSNEEEDIAGLLLLGSALFKNFINNEVNIKEILKQDSTFENLPKYDVLREKVYTLLGRIVSKVNKDRRRDDIRNDARTNDATNTTSISSEERAIRAAKGQQKYEENVAKGINPIKDKPRIVYGKDIFTYSNGPSQNMVSSSSSSSSTSKSSKGGRIVKKTYKHKNKKVKHSIKKKVQRRKDKKTKKSQRVYKKTRRA